MWTTGRRSRMAVALASALMVGACASSPPPSAGQSPTGLANGTACVPLELRSPSGQQVDLTGTWVGASDVIVARQWASCIWWEYWSNLPDEPPGSAWRAAFFGTVRADFTIDLRYGDIYTFSGPNGWIPRGDGVSTGEIEFGASGDVDDIILRLHGLPGSLEPRPVVEYIRVTMGTELPASQVPHP